MTKIDCFSYQLNDKTKVKGPFRIYQARSGAIILLMGNGHTELSLTQIKELLIDSDLYEMKDFDIYLYHKHYKIGYPQE